MHGQDKIQRIRDLIANGEIEDAITLLQETTKGTDANNTVIIQSTRFQTLRKQRRDGEISFEDATRTQNQIGNSLIEILRDLGGHHSSSLTPHPFVSKLPSTTPHLFGREK